jgi:peptidyl-prolyl cis-trans isomerase B (cyclophilin B)
VPSSKSRQRALARAKAERQIARRAAAARKRRQWQAGIGGAVVLALVVLGTIWAAGGFKPAPVKPDDCAWTAVDTTTDTNAKQVGMPPTQDIPKSGSEHLTITTNQGTISALLDPAKAPCTVASMKYLAGKRFFDNTTCGRLATKGSFLLQCGDPGTSGKGGPAYRYKTEYTPPVLPNPSPSASSSASPTASADPNAPTGATATYSRGVIATWNDGTPDSNGSQFFIVYQDSVLNPNYTVFGTVTDGLDVVDKVAKGGHDGTFDKPDETGVTLGGGHPKITTTIQSLTISDTAPATPAPSVPASSGPPASASATPSSKS